LFYIGKLDKYFQYLIVGLFFTSTLSLTFSKLFSILIILFWFFSGQYKAKLSAILNNNLALASIAFFTWQVIGLAWTENFEWGIRILIKTIEFLILIPILLTIVRYENFKIYTAAFMLGIILTILLVLLEYSGFNANLNLLEYINYGLRAPFLGSISQGIFFAVATFIVLKEINLLIKNGQFSRKLFKSGFLVAILFLLIALNFDSFSRAGQISTLLALFIFALTTFRFKTFFLFFGAFFIIIISIFWNYSETFKHRVYQAYSEVISYSNGKLETTSVGQRLFWSEKSLEISKNNFLFGVGTGDFKNELDKEIRKVDTNIPSHVNPHNMYLLVLVQSGFIGLLLFLNIFFTSIYKTYREKDKLKKNYGIFFNALFLLIMFSDSYLLGHFTQLLFAIFFSAIYSNSYELRK